MTAAVRPARGAARTALLLVLLLAGSAIGGWRALSTLGEHPGSATLLVGGVSYTVTHVEQVQGLADADLGGMSHGIQSLVAGDQALLVVSLVVSAGDSASSFDPAALRAVARGSTLPPAGGTLAAGRLRRHGHVEGSVSFVVPRNGSTLALHAPGGSADVPLLQVGVAATPEPSGSHHP